MDFGCYSGGLLASLGEQYEKFGLEVNQAAAATTSARSKATVWRQLEDVPEYQKFDFIVASDVIEHMPNPGIFLDSMLNLLRPDGHLIMTTGDADNFLWNRFGANWWYCYYPEHISFICKRWIYAYAAARGCRVKKFEKFRYRQLGPVSYVLNAILTVFYGIAPGSYLRTRAAVNKLLRRPPGEIPMSGVGISADHMFVVLAPAH